MKNISSSTIQYSSVESRYWINNISSYTLQYSSAGSKYWIQNVSSSTLQYSSVVGMQDQDASPASNLKMKPIISRTLLKNLEPPHPPISRPPPDHIPNQPYHLHPDGNAARSHPSEHRETWNPLRAIQTYYKNLFRSPCLQPHQPHWPPDHRPKADHTSDSTSSYSHCPTTPSPAQSSKPWPENAQLGNLTMDWKPLWFLPIDL